MMRAFFLLLVKSLIPMTLCGWLRYTRVFLIPGFQWRREKEVSVYFCSAKCEERKGEFTS